jgi:PAS domain S-box-containing protein
LDLDQDFRRALVDSVPDALIVTDDDGRIVFVNAACEAMFQYARAELLSQPIELLVPEHLRAAHRHAHESFPRATIARPMATGMVFAGRRKDGTDLPVDVSLGTVHQGNRVCFVAVVRDATARQAAEEALRQSEQRHRQLLESAPEGIFLATPDGLYTDVNAAGCRLLGYTREELIGRSITELVAPEALARQGRLTRRILAGGTEVSEWELRRKDGTFVPVEITADALPDGHLRAFVRDTSERRRAEEEREEALQQLEAVLEECPVGIVLATGAHGEHLRLNARAKLLVGRPIERLGQYLGMVLTPDQREIDADTHPVLRALRGENFDSVELLLQQADGSQIPMSMSGAPLPAARDGSPRAIVTMLDISAVKQLERLRAEWSSIVAHDLRQPLNGITLHAGVIARALSRAGGSGEVLRATEVIKRSATRLNRMIGDLLDLSQLEAHRIALSRHSTDLVALVRTTVESSGVEEMAPVHVHAEGTIPEVSVDPDRIAQVLENLLSNAAKYGTEGAPIVVEVGATADRVHVSVTNEGQGIAPEDLQRLFGRFVRTQDAKRSTVKGIGLGLHVAHALVTAHGGEMTAESVPGGLTTFRFAIPIRPAGNGTSPPPTA